jgi:PKD repeat protein
VEANGSGLVIGTYSFPDDGTYPVIVTVVDSTGQSGSAIVAVDVQNVPPFIDRLTDPKELKDSLHMSPIPFSDLGLQDSHTAVIDWGDGVQSIASINPSFRNIGGTHTYQDPGTYTLAVMVTDDDGGIGSTSSSIQIVAPNTPLEIPSLKWWAMITLSAFFITVVYIWPRPASQNRDQLHRT